MAQSKREQRHIGPALVERRSDGSVIVVVAGAMDPVFTAAEAAELAAFLGKTKPR